MEPKNIPRTWGHETDGDLNATRARERTKYGDREKLDASPMPVFSLNRQPVLQIPTPRPCFQNTGVLCRQFGVQDVEDKTVQLNCCC
jgi:hypothetical protein